MNFHIIAHFPFNRDYKGTIKMYSHQGTLIYGPVVALGRGSNNPLTNDNNHSNWKMKNSDIPTGDYTASLIEAKPGLIFGPEQRIYLEPIAGNALIAKLNGRTGFMIHGGEAERNTTYKWYPLKATNGCIRISDKDQKNLVKLVNNLGSEGKLSVIEAETENFTTV